MAHNLADYNPYMLEISQNVTIPENEIEISAIRSSGAGGQNVNKVASAIHLRFDIPASSLPQRCKERLMSLQDQRINDRGIIVIKAQKYRTQERNRVDALQRLRDLVQSAMEERKRRIATRPPRSATRKRLENKFRRSQLKSLRRKVDQ